MERRKLPYSKTLVTLKAQIHLQLALFRRCNNVTGVFTVVFRGNLDESG